MSLTPDIIDNAAQVARIADEWNNLWHHDPAATPFQHPSWVLPWIPNLWGGGQLIVLTFRKDSRLVGVAPLFKWGEGRISWLGTGISDYLGVTVAPEHAPEVTRAFFAALSDMEWQLCHFQEQSENSPLLRVRPPPTIVAQVENSSVCPVVDVGPHWSCPGGLAKTIRYSENRLHSTGAVRLERGDPSELLPIFFRLHAERWNGEGVVGSQALQSFHREAISPFTRLYCLRVNGEPIAVQYCLFAKQRLYIYLSGFDRAWSAFSPGSILLKYAIESAIVEGGVAADFLRNPEPYKYRWGARDHWNRTVTLLRAG